MADIFISFQQPDEPEEPGEVADDDGGGEESFKVIIPTKLHIRGVDNLHTDDIKAYVKAHFGVVDRVEWIDDTSANLVFSSEPTARDALVALSSIEIADATALGAGESLPAKPLHDRSETTLHVRFAVQSDKKQAGAALRSRYYLLHPEYDPEERHRRRQDNRQKYRERDHHGRDSRRDLGRRRRDSYEDVEPFEASMYDDAPCPSTARRYSDPEEGPGTQSRENRGKELFAGRASGQIRSRRDRSASPRRDSDGDANMDGPPSSTRNRTTARSIKDRISSEKETKELFPSKSSSKRGGGQLDQLERAIGSARLQEEDIPKVVTLPDHVSNGSLNIRGFANQHPNATSEFTIKGAANARELFPDKLGGANVGKELIDVNRTKRRQRAEDLFS